MADIGTFNYFNVMAKGLPMALVCELSGAKWTGGVPADWPALKPTTPFGQMPLLTTPEGTMIAQCMAIAQYIGIGDTYTFLNQNLELVGDDLVESYTSTLEANIEAECSR